MQYRIFGENLPALTLTMETGERVFTQSGGMTWMSDGFSMETNMRGGVMKSLGRMFAGESIFMATYTAGRPGAEITFSSSFPGSILPLALGGREYICQKQSFLCATEGVELSLAPQLGRGGFFGGEGLLLERLSGRGMAFLELDGSVVEKNLAPGEVIKVSTGNVAAWEGSVSYTAETVRGFANIFFGGEGLFLTVLQGPGKVWLQTINMADFAGRILPYLPARRD